MDERFDPTLAAAHARVAAVRPAAYARTRNALDGAVSGLSPYITHGCVTLSDVLAGVWFVLPGWRWLAAAGHLPDAAWAMERCYRLLLSWRPMLQLWVACLDPPARDNTPR
jgi:hypothetical protein